MSGENTLATRWLGRIPYDDALGLQQELVTRRRAGKIPDTLLLLEHDPVYTIGRIRDQSSLAARESLPHPVIETNRGGQATYHGPGQLVGYPILDLRFHGQDLHAYLRTLEQILIDTCATYHVAARRQNDRTGVWCEDRKIASIGVGVRHWISMHGFAINIGGDLSGFESIIPCGLPDVRMTSLSLELGTAVGVEEFAQTLAPLARTRLGPS